MADYRQEQNEFMRDLEDYQRNIEQRDIEDIIGTIDPDLRRRIVRWMKVKSPRQFKRVSEKVCFERWKTGFRAGTPIAAELLALAYQSWTVKQNKNTIH